MNKKYKTIAILIMNILSISIPILFGLQIACPEKFNTKEIYGGLTSLNLAQLIVFLLFDFIMILDIILVSTKKIEIFDFNGQIWKRKQAEVIDESNLLYKLAVNNIQLLFSIIIPLLILVNIYWAVVNTIQYHEFNQLLNQYNLVYSSSSVDPLLQQFNKDCIEKTFNGQMTLQHFNVLVSNEKGFSFINLNNNRKWLDDLQSVNDINVNNLTRDLRELEFNHFASLDSLIFEIIMLLSFIIFLIMIWVKKKAMGVFEPVDKTKVKKFLEDSADIIVSGLGTVVP